MNNTPGSEEPCQSFGWPIPDAKEAPGLAQGLDGFSIALKALRMVTDAGIAAAENIPLDATAEEVRQGWLASLMPLRYTVHHLQFRSASLIQAIGDMLEQG